MSIVIDYYQIYCATVGMLNYKVQTSYVHLTGIDERDIVVIKVVVENVKVHYEHLVIMISTTITIKISVVKMEILGILLEVDHKLHYVIFVAIHEKVEADCFIDSYLMQIDEVN